MARTMQNAPMALLLASVALGLCPSAGLGQGLGPGNPIKNLNEQVAALEARVAALETASTGTVRIVFEVQIDPSTDGDETFSYPSRTDHYAKISTGTVSLSDPPLIKVFYRPAPKVLGGNLPAPDTTGAGQLCMEGVNVETRPWSLARETADLRAMAIGVYSRPAEEWVFGKNGRNGFLAASHQEWIDKLSRLILDPALRERTGRAGRATVEKQFSVKVTAPVYLRIIESVVEPASALTPDGRAAVSHIRATSRR